MLDPAQFVGALAARGINLSVADGDLVYESAVPVPRGISTTIAAERQHLLTYFRQQKPTSPILEPPSPETPPLFEGDAAPHEGVHASTAPSSYTGIHVLPQGEPVGDNPEASLRAAIAHIGRLPERPTPMLVYETAVLELVLTFREEVQAAQYEKYRERLLDGTPLEDATPAQLRAAALGYYGWARDKAQNGARNKGGWAWLEAAEEVLAGYRQPVHGTGA